MVNVTGLHVPASLSSKQPQSAAGVAVLADLMRLSERVAEADERALEVLQMRSLDALAMSHLAQAERDGRLLSPSHLTRTLKVSSAAVTKLVDRLVDAGRIERRPNPRDRRGVVLAPLGTAVEDVARVYGQVHSPVVDAIDELSDADAAVVGRFASRLAAALQRTTANT